MLRQAIGLNEDLKEYSFKYVLLKYPRQIFWIYFAECSVSLPLGLIDWFIDFYGLSTRLELFYA